MLDLLGDTQIHLIVVALSGLIVLVTLRYLVLRIIYMLSKSSELNKMSFDVLRKHYFPSLYVFLGLFIYDVTAFALELEVYEGLFNTAVLISFTWVMAKTIKLVSWIIYRRYDYQLVGGNNI